MNESAGNPAGADTQSGSSGDASAIAASDPPASDQSRKFIVFAMGGEHFAVDSQNVSEVVRNLDTVPLPNTPDWLLGIANLRSEIVTVVDVEHFAGGRSAPGHHSPKHVVVRMELMDALIAFRVDRLREILTIDQSKIKAVSDRKRPFISGTFDHRAEQFTVLNIGRLVESLTLN